MACLSCSSEPGFRNGEPSPDNAEPSHNNVEPSLNNVKPSRHLQTERAGLHTKPGRAPHVTLPRCWWPFLVAAKSGHQDSRAGLRRFVVGLPWFWAGLHGSGAGLRDGAQRAAACNRSLVLIMRSPAPTTWSLISKV